jgi:hypothetical protein
MRYSRAEWLLITSVFGLSVAANLPAELQAVVTVTPAALQIILCVLLVFALVRYVPLPIVIAFSMLVVGSGVPWILDDHFKVGYWVFLAIIAFLLLLSLGYRTLNAKDKDAPSNGGTSQNVQALFRVVGRGNLAWTYRLIAMGADVNVRNEAGQTPLMLATEKGYADMVQVLIQHGANPKLVNNQGESALTIALMKGYTRIAESLELAEASHKYVQGEGREKL